MSKTYRRKNAYDSKRYVEDWFEDGVCKYDFMKNVRSVRSIKTRSAHYHSDNYKPYSSSSLKFVKKQTSAESRTLYRNNLKRLERLNDYEDYDENNDKGKKNRLMEIYVL